MNPQLQRQILVGVIAAVVVGALAYFGTGGKRDERDGLVAKNAELQRKVDTGKQLKKQYEALQEEVDKQQKRIDALIKIMPSEADVNSLPYQVKKLSDTAGLQQTAFAAKGEAKKEYYTEKQMDFEFKASYHTFGQFASQVSGYERIININSLEITRAKDAGANAIYPATVKCSISAFVYNPEPAAGTGPVVPPAGGPAKTSGGAKKSED
jgi:type IV pilus assembly protein PilO